MPEAHLLSARLASIAQAGFVPAAQAIQQRLPLLFEQPTKGRFTVLDCSCGEGDFLSALQGPRADLYGVEISGLRVFEARRRLPQALIVHAPYEETVVSRGRVCVGLANFMYAYQEGERTEHIGIATLTPLLTTGGILCALLPVRSAWNSLLINHLVKYYHDVRVWRVPGAPYELYTQILVVAVKRARPLRTVDEALPEKRWLEQWIVEGEDDGQPSYRGGTPPSEMPMTPLEAPYRIPAVCQPVHIRVLRPDDSLLLQYLTRSGVHTTSAWQEATTWIPDTTIEQPLVPVEGEAHIAACAMLDMFLGEEFQSPDGKRYTFLAHLGKEWVPVEPDAEERREGVVGIKQEQDSLRLSVLNMSEGQLTHYRNEEVYAFLAPWLPLMKRLINERYPALYQGKPQRWLVEVTARIGLDGALLGSASPGLVREQLETVWAMWAALNARGRVGLAGEQGVGKTRITIALIAAFAHAWRHAREVFGERPPRWLTNLEAAWAANPRVPGGRPQALPCLIECPLNVVEDVWVNEIRAAWPEAETVIVNEYADIRLWFSLCAQSQAPAVIAILPQSKTRATRLRWVPAVLQRKRPMRLLDRSDASLLAGGIPDLDEQGNLRWYLDPATRLPMYRTEWVERFYCPHCGRLLLGKPMKSRGGKETAALEEDGDEAGASGDEDAGGARAALAQLEQDRLEPVGSIAYFEFKRRWCSCGSALWSVARTAPVERRHPRLSYAQWLQAMRAFVTTITSPSGAAGEDHSSISTRGPELASWMNRDGLPLVRLAEWGERSGGPLCLQAPDLVLEGAVPLLEGGARYGYVLPTGEEVAAVYDPRTRKRAGYVSHQSGNLLAKRFSFVAPPADSFSPYAYLEQFFAGLVAFAQIDEGHNARNRDTDVGASTQEAQRAAQTYAYGTGTPYGGVLRSFYYEQARLNFRFWQKLGLGWGDSGKAQKRFGFSRVLTYERVIENADHRGSGRTVTTDVVQSTPGLAVSLIPRLFSEWIDFTLDQMGTHLPPRIETPILLPLEDPMLEGRHRAVHEQWQEAREREAQVRTRYHELKKAMPPPPEDVVEEAGAQWRQAHATLASISEEKRWIGERDLQEAYREATERLKEWASSHDAARIAQDTLLRLWTVLPFYRDPRYALTETLRGEWGDLEGQHVLYRLPVLAEDYLYPLERMMLETVAREVAASRPIAVAFLQNGKRNAAARLQWVLRDFHPWVLTNDIPSMEREQAVKNAVASGYKVIIMPFQRMREGSNLQPIKSVYWAELPPDDLFVLEQYTRRFWRLKQDQEVHVYFPVMVGTAAFHTLYRLGMKSAGLSLFLGKTPNSGLARLVGAHKMALARLSAAIAQGADMQDGAQRELEQLMSQQIAEVFEQRNAAFRTLTSSPSSVRDDEIWQWIQMARRPVPVPIVSSGHGAGVLAAPGRVDAYAAGNLYVEHPWETWWQREQALRREQKQKRKDEAKAKARYRRLVLQQGASFLRLNSGKKRQKRKGNPASQQLLWGE